MSRTYQVMLHKYYDYIIDSKCEQVSVLGSDYHYLRLNALAEEPMTWMTDTAWGYAGVATFRALLRNLMNDFFDSTILNMTSQHLFLLLLFFFFFGAVNWYWTFFVQYFFHKWPHRRLRSNRNRTTTDTGKEKQHKKVIKQRWNIKAEHWREHKTMYKD